MKRIAIVLAVLFLTTAFAQATDFGFKAGLNMANVSGDLDENKMMLTFGAGVFAKFDITPQFSIQPEALYMMKGAKWEWEEDGIEIDEKLKLNYLEIPVLFKYQFPMEGSVSPSLFAGPCLGILTSAKDAFSGEGVDIDLDIKDSLKTTDFGLVFGGGLDVKTGEKGKFTVDARYTLGLTNVNDKFLDENDDVVEVKNGVFSFFVGYAFPIGQ